MPWGSKSDEKSDVDYKKAFDDLTNENKKLKEDLQKATTDHAATKSAFETFQGEFDSKVESKVTDMVNRAQAERQRASTQPEPMADFLTDPERAFAQRIAPLAGVVTATASFAAKNAVRDKLQRSQRNSAGKNFDGYFFEKFEGEIDQLAATCTPQQLANPATWEHLFYNVKGRHADEIAAQFTDGSLRNIVESGTAGARRADEVHDETKLTEQETRIAAKLGMKPEDYLEQKKKIATSGIGVTLNV
jgi:hypothetical protein